MSLTILKSLEDTFGQIPSFIFENVKYFTYDDDYEEFTCVPCDKIVKKVTNNKTSTTKNFKSHLFSKSHKEVSSSINEITQSLVETFAGKIPQIVLNNIYLLGIDEINYKCVICDKTLKVSKYPSISENNFSYHLLSYDHEKNLEEYKETEGQLVDVYGEIPEVINNNKEFLRLSRSGKSYVCTVCNVLLRVDETEMEETENRFKDHFYSLEHIRQTKLFQVHSLIPEMKQNAYNVPNYILANIDYMSINGADLFCSLCNENIKCNHNDVIETEANLKVHILSSEGHEENLLDRKDPDNEVLSKLNDIFDEFTDALEENLRYLKLTDNTFTCTSCEEEIYTGLDCDEVKYHVEYHFESDFHNNGFTEEMQRRANLIERLEDILGTIPPLIKENIKYIEFKGGNTFQCTLCDATLLSKKNSNDAEYIAKITQENFERHLSMSQHKQALEDVENISDELKAELDNLFEPIPLFIHNNWDNLKYDSDSENFFCILCNQDIIVDIGNKKEEVTLKNFRTHIFSNSHVSNLKIKAKIEVEVFDKLVMIFGGVPNIILSNVEHLFEDEDEYSFHCDICDAEIREGYHSDTTKRNFYQHLRGYRHRSNLGDVESSIENAFNFLDSNFWRVPEFLLRNIDFLEKWDEDLYCSLCQEVLEIDEDDLLETEHTLRSHMDSDRHKFNLKNF